MGAGGLVGTILRRELADRFDVRAFDLHPDRAEHVRRLDARHLRAVQRALAGCDAVIDLVADARPNAPWKSVYRTNLWVLPTILEACRRAEVRRVVYMSSNHTMAGYEFAAPWSAIIAGHEQATASQPPALLSVDAPTRPRSAYGASKIFGEAACAWYSAEYGVTTTSLRIGSVLEPDRPRSPRHLVTWLSHRDLAGLTEAALRCADADLPPVVWGVSNNTRRIWETVPSYPGYTRQDDAELYRDQINSNPR